MGEASNLSTSSMDDVFLVRFVALTFLPSAKPKISDFLLNGPDPHLNEPDPKLNELCDCRENGVRDHPTDAVFPYTPGSVRM